MARMRLTDDLIDMMLYAGNKVKIKDDLIPRLYLMIYRKSRVWIHMETYKGKTKKFKLGTYPSMKTDEARQRSLKFVPEEYEKDRYESMSVCDVWQIYMDRKASKKRSWHQIKPYYDKYVKPYLDDVTVSEFQRMDVEDWHQEITNSVGAVTANRALQYMKAAYNYCQARDVINVNPPLTVELNKEECRRRYLTEKEMKRFLAALSMVDQVHQDIIKVMLFTGHRKSQVFSMRWDAIDMDQEVWYAKVKGDRLVTIPFCSEVMNILRRRWKNRVEGKDYVFYQHGRRNSHVKNMEVPWNKIREATGLHDVTMHDLRRTLASWQVQGGESLKTVQETLAHRSQVSTEIYAHLDTDSVRDSVNRTVSRMLNSLGPS